MTEIKNNYPQFITINDFRYEIGSPKGDECPTSSACMYCNWFRFSLPNRRLCLFPKALYGSNEAYREYMNTRISIKELIEKYNPNYQTKVIKKSKPIKKKIFNLLDLEKSFKLYKRESD